LGKAARATRTVPAGTAPIGSGCKLMDHLHDHANPPPEFADSI